MFIIGIDPGKGGARATIQDGKLFSVCAYDGEITKCRDLGFAPHMGDTIIFIEQVTTSPNQGRVSAFTFGRFAEAVETTSRLSGWPVHMVRPVIWQNAIGVYSEGDKAKLYDKVKELFPEEYAKKMFNKASSDAVLIAYYGWRYYENNKEGQ